MLKLMRFLCALTLLVWLGTVITTTFYVAPSLFSNESGHSPNSTVAANIIAPLLHKMEMTGWIALPIAMALHIGIWLALRRSARRALFISLGLLALAWLGGLYSGITLNRELHSIRSDLKAELGGYHLAPPDHPMRARFARLHGISMVIVVLNLGLGLGSFFCVTQLMGADSAGGKSSANLEPASL